MARADGIARLTGKDVRGLILDAAFRYGANHIGSALSVSDALAAIYGGVLRGDGPADPKRDRFVLSKGHAAYALYAALHLRGWLANADFLAACQHHHPDPETPGVEYATGSLGMGITYATGAALALARRGGGERVYGLISDAEAQEGSVWEAAGFAAGYGLGNLCVLVDANNSQALGPARDGATDLVHKFDAFGFSVYDAENRTVESCLRHAFRRRGPHPTAIVVRSVLGLGVPFMEGDLAWHYHSMTQAQYAEAVRTLC